MTTSPPTTPLSGRFRLALVLLALSYLFGLPMAAGFGAASAWSGSIRLAACGGGSYALSWILLGAAIALGGSSVVG